MLNSGTSINFGGENSFFMDIWCMKPFYILKKKMQIMYYVVIDWGKHLNALSCPKKCW